MKFSLRLKTTLNVNIISINDNMLNNPLISEMLLQGVQNDDHQRIPEKRGSLAPLTKAFVDLDPYTLAAMNHMISSVNVPTSKQLNEFGVNGKAI